MDHIIASEVAADLIRCEVCDNIFRGIHSIDPVRFLYIPHERVHLQSQIMHFITIQQRTHQQRTNQPGCTRHYKRAAPECLPRQITVCNTVKILCQNLIYLITESSIIHRFTPPDHRSELLPLHRAAHASYRNHPVS